MAERPRRQTKKVSRSEDYIENIDAELEAIESLPIAVAFPSSAQVGGGPRKRGRPRKHPQAPPPAPEIQPIKRPRGRPRGSGKHQKAAAALMAALTESGVSRAETGTDLSEVGELVATGRSPSVATYTLGGAEVTHNPNSHARLSQSVPHPSLHILTPAGDTGENGSLTPHYPPRAVGNGDNAILPELLQLDKITSKSRKGTKEPSIGVKEERRGSVGLMAPLPTKTPMQKPRNRRKVANPTKTE